MLQEEVRIGLLCTTLVGGRRLKVIVVDEVQVHSPSGGSLLGLKARKLTRYKVKRVDTGSELPKPRAAAALYALKDNDQ